MFTAATKVFEEVTTEFSLTLSIPNTKLLVAGAHITTDDVLLLEFADGGMEVVKEIKYLGSPIEVCCEMTGEFDC